MLRRAAACAAAVALFVVPAAPAAAEPDITAPGAVLWDPTEDAALVDKAASTARRPASTTKVMTILLALEAGTADDIVTVSAAAARAGGASLDLRAGQQLPMSSLLAGLVLRSGNDAAIAVAEHVAGSEEAFVERMNARAAELGMTSTHFINASGLTDDARHRSSPRDLARLAEVAMRDERFATWAGAPRLTVPGLAPMETRNLLLGAYPGADGVKTGFLTLAGFTLIASATRDGWRLYAVVLGSEDSFGDATALLDHGFATYRRADPLAAEANATVYRWAGAEVPVLAALPLGATVRRDQRVTWRAVLQPGLRRPVDAGAVLGEAQLLVDGRVERSAPLLAAQPVEPAAQSTPPAAVGAALQEALRALALLVPAERAVD